LRFSIEMQHFGVHRMCDDTRTRTGLYVILFPFICHSIFNICIVDGTSLWWWVMFKNLFKDYYSVGFYELLLHILMFF